MPRVLPALALLAGLAACGAAPPVVVASSAPPPASASPAGDITLAFAGDVHFTDRTAKLLADPARSFGPIASVLADADLTMLNFESAITARGTPQAKQFHFRTQPAALDAVRAAGVDVVTFANNHVLDYGQVGLADTLAAARAARFPYVGIGTDADAAWAPYLTTIKGRRFAFLGASQVDELAASWVATPARPGEAHVLDLARTLAAVAAAKRQADTVVVFMHWGTEGNGCPNAAQKSLAPKLAAAGADVIIGAHAHTLQGSGWLGHTFVAYGMANFLWWLPSYSTETGVLKLTLHPDRTLTDRFYPAVVSDTGQPVPATGPDADRIGTRYAGLRACAGLAAVPS
jgi:2',3'-cyclic-nucleotide 2'-phosphodiesterase (5'-nucleotidase family)